MLLRHALVLPSILFVAVCTIISAPTDPKTFRRAVRETLENPHVSNYLFSDHLSILRGFGEKLPICKPFLIYTCQNYEPSEYPRAGNNPHFWSELLNRHLKICPALQRPSASDHGKYFHFKSSLFPQASGKL